MIKLENIVKTFRSRGKAVEAVRGVSLDVEQSGIFGIVGYSGAGKSTLLRCVNLLERPDSGKVLVNGYDLTSLSERELESHRRKIGMIFQHFNLLRSKTVAANIALPLRYLKKSKGEIEKRVDELLDLVGLADKKGAYPAELSGGQKQRVGIARALVNEPEVLLCDEATSALDPQMTDSILELLRELNEKLALTMVVVTHEMAVVKELCDSVAVMEDGQIVETGDLYDVFAAPRMEITRKFVSGLLKLDGLKKLFREESFRNILVKGGGLYHLVFTGECANLPYVSWAVQKFGIDANIIYGAADVIAGKHIGNLFLILNGKEDSLANSIAYLESKGVRVIKLPEADNEFKVLKSVEKIL
jgi:D-methionine transport system ATP-binding protein